MSRHSLQPYSLQPTLQATDYRACHVAWRVLAGCELAFQQYRSYRADQIAICRRTPALQAVGGLRVQYEIRMNLSPASDASER